MTRPIRAVVLDWDETITERDTMSILANVTRDSARWQSFVDAYTADLAAHEAAYAAPRETLAEHFAYLDALGDVERASVRRIEAAGAFRGVTPADLARAADAVPVRPGFRDFCRRLAEREGRDGPVVREILSVHWSATFIRAGLARALGEGADAAAAWTVSANELDLDAATDTGTGSVSKEREGGIRTGLDKLRRLAPRRAAAHGAGGLLVYVGDSGTDLPCLLAADVGVVFGRNASLQATCDRYDITLRPIKALSLSRDGGGGGYEWEERVLYRAESWDDIRL